VRDIGIPGRRGITPALVLAIGLLLSGTAAAGVAAMSSARDTARFQHAVEGAKDRITARLEAYITLLRGGAAFFSVSEEVTYEEFAGFVRRFRVPEFYPGVQGVGFSARVRLETFDSLVAAQRSGAFPDFRIWPEDPPREELHSILFLYPLDARNEFAIGYDMYSEETRRAAMSAARDSGRVVMSGPVTLVQEILGPTQAGFLLYAPIYASGTVPATIERRREELVGFFYAPFRGDDLFSGIFGSEERPLVAFRVYDGGATVEERLLHDSSVHDIVAAEPPGFEAVERMEIAGRPWIISFASTPAFEAGSRQHVAMLMLVLGLTASGVLFFVARREAAARDSAESLASRLRATTGELEAQISEVRELNGKIERANTELTEVVDALRRSNIELDALKREADASRDEAFRANQAKSEFLAAMSHELRTPLNAIVGYAELLEMGVEGPVTERQRHALQRIRRSQTHLLGLINDILNFAKIEAGAVQVRRDRVPVERVLADLEALTVPQVLEKGHTLSREGEASGIAVLGDEEKIRQILVNLLGNAIKFTDRGGCIRLIVEDAGEAVRVSVADNGPGIPAERIESIFDPFVQIDRSADRDGEHGVGLGLAISHDLAQLMEGEIAVVAEPGCGSVFTLILPRAF
jgi:signal transduction histidine kinase